ncbi:MAG: DUF5668 domain-containing protein [candidate division Zixibacteria bacterium]|nr:DUF5668 domain-containing protein [candidate division Zixibacteria bacterium]
MNPARFRWGVLFILAGVLLLLNNMDRLDWWVWADILNLWPLLLIAIGVEKIFTRTKAEFVAYLSSLALAGVIVWVAFSGANAYGTSDRDSEKASDSKINTLVSRIEMKKNNLHLGGTTGRAYTARYGNRYRAPEVDYTVDGTTGKLTITDRQRWRWIQIGHRLSNALDIDLTESVPIRLTCEGETADMRLDCRDLMLEELTVSSESGRVGITLGRTVDRTKVSLKGEDADFRLTLPDNCALRVEGGNADIARFLNRIGLIGSGSTFTVEGYDTLSPKIDLDLSPDISQLTIDYF